jgi:DNA-directed RNA polymerase subunit L
MVIACNVMNNRLAALVTLMETDELSIEPSQNAMENSYDIKLVNEDYTLGKVLEYLLYTKFFEQMKIMTYCGFKKMHPHDNYSLIRVAYRDPIDKASIKINLKSCVDDAVKVFSRIKSMFVDNRSKLQEQEEA